MKISGKKSYSRSNSKSVDKDVKGPKMVSKGRLKKVQRDKKKVNLDILEILEILGKLMSIVYI